MAFTGTAVVKQVSDSVVRITGISLDGDSAGTISLHAGSGSVKCPDGFFPNPYKNEHQQTVTLQDSVQVYINFTTVNSPSDDAVNLLVVKTGTDASDFLITISNPHTDDPTLDTGELEIYVLFHN